MSPGHPAQPGLPQASVLAMGPMTGAGGPRCHFCSLPSTVGPCFFLSCPVGIEDFRTWFIDLWNNSIIPYLQEGAKDGLKVPRAAWHLGDRLTQQTKGAEGGRHWEFGHGWQLSEALPCAAVECSTGLESSGCHVVSPGPC